MALGKPLHPSEPISLSRTICVGLLFTSEFPLPRAPPGTSTSGQVQSAKYIHMVGFIMSECDETRRVLKRGAVLRSPCMVERAENLVPKDLVGALTPSPVSAAT